MNCQIPVTASHHGKSHTLRDAESISRTLATECAMRIRKFLYSETFSCLSETCYKQFVFQLEKTKKKNTLQIHVDLYFNLQIKNRKNFPSHERQFTLQKNLRR